MSKKITGIALVLCILLSILPINVFAANSLSEDMYFQQEGQKYYVKDNSGKDVAGPFDTEVDALKKMWNLSSGSEIIRFSAGTNPNYTYGVDFSTWVESADHTYATVNVILYENGIAIYTGIKRVNLLPTVQNKCTVIFNTNGGGNVASVDVEKGTPVSRPSDPIRTGYIFVGWYTDSNLTQLYDFNLPVNDNLTLYARWSEIQETEHSFLDEGNEGITVNSFNTDVWDVPVGEVKKVTFTAEVFSESEIGGNEISVIVDNSTTLGYMNDDGVDGDATAKDGIFTLCSDLESSDETTHNYSISVNGESKEEIVIGFYTLHDEEDLQSLSDVISDIDEIVSPYIGERGYIESDSNDSVVETLCDRLDNLEKDGIIESYSVDGITVKINLPSGLKYWYIVAPENTDSAVVASNQPFKDTYNPTLQAQSNEATDGSARKVARAYEEYRFYSTTAGDELNTDIDDNYDSEEVSLDALKRLSENQIVAWHGHGGYDSSLGSFMGTGTLFSPETFSQYEDDINAGRLILSNGRFWITGGFIEKYCGNLNGHFLYLGTCSSAHDMVDGIANRYELIRELLNKGATAVVGNTSTISTDYNTKMERDVFDRLCQVDANGIGYTLSESLQYAKERNGEHDPYSYEGTYSEAVIFPRNNVAANNYKLHNSETGTVVGMVKDASTSRNISNALVQIYSREGIYLTSVRSNSDGEYQITLPSGEYIFMVSAGHYKSAKLAVSVTSGGAIYTEAFLLVDVILRDGFANGRITSAVVSDQGVSDVTIKVRSGWGNLRGDVIYSTITNENGYYEISYRAGAYTIEYSKSGYVTGYRNIIVASEDYASQNAVISPLTSEDTYRIVLTWRNEPSDLDSHLSGPLPNGERFHMYYPYADANSGSPYPQYVTLDLDNTSIRTRSDPETTTIHQQINGKYVFSVHDYSNGGDSRSTYMARSNAVVTLYKGNTIIATFHVPTNMVGTIWSVFELDGDTVTPLNRIGNGYAEDEMFDPYLGSRSLAQTDLEQGSIFKSK